MKAYTDLEQSKKLAEILPLETADMWLAERYAGHATMDYQYVVEETPYYYLSLKKPSIDNYSQDTIKDIPCWSLTALLDVIPSVSLDSSDDHHYRLRCKERFSEWHDNPIDACVAMIEKLNELKLL